MIDEEGDIMEQQIQKHNDFINAALGYSLLSLVGSCLSIINMIPLIITYQLLQEAKLRGISPFKEKLINTLFQIAILLTICITLIYANIQL